MAASDFIPERISVSDLLLRRYYVIPRFQRPFGWDLGNVEELWRDAFEDADKGYFIGPMVGWRKSKSADTAFIVDGQQRLTTIMLFLSVLREHFDDSGQAKLANGLQQYIERKDVNDEPRYVLNSELASTFLTGTLLARQANRTLQAATEEHRRLEAARGRLADLVNDDLGQQSDDKARVKRLRELRDRALDLQMIWIEHQDEDDAYVVFETLNSRGKDLEPVDLLKNLLLSRLRTPNRGGDVPAERWRRLRVLLDDAGVNANAFILHWWLSQEDYVAQRRLFQAIKKRVRTDAEARLKSLEEDAPRYRTMQHPETAHWTNEALPIRDALEALKIFRMTQPAPLLLALLRARDQGIPKLKQIAETFKFVESFHFQFTAIAARSSSGGISERYAKYARLVTAAADANERARVLREFRAVHAHSAPDAASVKSDFMDLIFTDDITKDRRLIEYALGRLHQHSSRLVPRAPSIEHLLPQDQIGAVAEKIVGNIGNLLWVDENLNGQLANKSFADKQAILRRHASNYDVADVLAATSWGQPEIEARAKRLADLAVDVVWKLPQPTT